MVGIKRIYFVAVLTILLTLSLPTYAEEINFTFNPPPDLSYRQLMSSTKKLSYETGQSQTDVSQAEISIDVQKTKTGYNMTATPVSMTMFRNDQPIENPLFSILSDLVVHYDIDSNGKLLGVSGYDEFLEAARNSMPPEIINTIQSVFNKQSMTAKEMSEWNGRIGNFVGEKISLGDKWIDTTDFLLPDGDSLLFYTVTKFEELVDCNGQDCLKITFHYHSKPDSLEKKFGMEIADIIKEDTDTTVTGEITYPELYGEGYRIINPATMLIYDEYTNRTIRMVVLTQAMEPMIVTIYEEKKYDYAY